MDAGFIAVFIFLGVTLVGGLLFATLERKPKRNADTCLNSNYCLALRSKACQDGRCRWHCSIFCKCTPIGNTAHVFTVIDGGRK